MADTNSSPIPAPVRSRMLWLLALAIFAAGVFVRVFPSAGFTGTGFDEVLYRDDVRKLDHVGIGGYPAICQTFLEDQRKEASMAKLPPTRFLYIFSAWVWKRAEFGDAPAVSPGEKGFAKRDPALVSLKRVSCLFSCLLLALSGVCAWRLLGLRAMPAVLALMACAPTQIHFAQHALIDGFFAFWATLCLWLLWENLQRPNNARWLAAFAFSLAAMVMTKENAAFVFVALGGLIVLNRWAKFGTVTAKLVLIGIAGPLAGLVLLVTLAGGVPEFVEIYALLVRKAEGLRYAILTGDGPWHRYLVDILLVSPLVLVFALGGVFTQLRTSRALVFLTAFVALSYALMCNVRFGMNLRYASIWELPLCALAAAQIDALTTRFGARQALVFVIAIVAMCAYELRQYFVFFVDAQLYELVSYGLLHAVKILK